MEPTIGPQQAPKTFVLCFDGTGNKFSGDESDSNVLKIFRVSFPHDAETLSMSTDHCVRCSIAIAVLSSTTINQELARM